MRKLAYYIIIGVLSLFSILPLKVHYFFSNILYFFLHKVFRYRYSVVITNISRSFPELKYGEIKKTAKEFYHHLSDIIVESIWAFTRSVDKIGKRADLKGVEELNKAIELNKNVIVMVGHIGNWEIFTGLPDLKERYGINLDNKNFVYVYKRQKSKLAEMIIEKIRNKHNSCSTIDAHNIIRYIAKHKEGKDVFFLICDQNPGKNENGTMVTFLNQKTYMIEGPEKIAVKMGMPVFYCGLLRTGRSKNSAVFEMICEDASACAKGEITKIYAKKLERDIINNKKSWLWSHKRWKKQII